MSGCCEGGCSLNARQQAQRQTLYKVLLINVVMFVVIVAGAFFGRSSALLADSLDNLGDALTYALSLYAVERGARAKARVAMVKGWLILGAALLVVAQAVYRLLVPELPIFEVMGAFSLMGLAANGVCLYLLTRHRGEDVNMQSVWECSRNDIASNLAVLVAAGLVWLVGAGWPDTLVALALASMLLRSALRVLGSARNEMRLLGG